MTIQIGDIRMSSDGRSLTITRDQHPEFRLWLDQESVVELVEVAANISETQAHQRRAFRVPIEAIDDISVQVQKGNTLHSVVARDLSVIGMCIEVAFDDPLTFDHDDLLQVFLEWQGQQYTCRGIVRRREDDRYGIYFPDSIKGDDVIDPPPWLTKMVMTLQANWMRMRAARLVD